MAVAAVLVAEAVSRVADTPFPVAVASVEARSVAAASGEARSAAVASVAESAGVALRGGYVASAAAIMAVMAVDSTAATVTALA